MHFVKFMKFSGHNNDFGVGVNCIHRSEADSYGNSHTVTCHTYDVTC